MLITVDYLIYIILDLLFYCNDRDSFSIISHLIFSYQVLLVVTFIYSSNREYHDEYDSALRTYDICILPLWESDGKGGNTLVLPELCFSRLLPDILVEVAISHDAITLRHHRFKYLYCFYAPNYRILPTTMPTTTSQPFP